MELHKRMKEIQTDSDVNVKTLAGELGVREHSMGNYLNGTREVPYEVLVKFARFYHVTTDYLLGVANDDDAKFLVSAEERTMVEQFRRLTWEQKELILQNIKLMGEQNRRK